MMQERFASAEAYVHRRWGCLAVGGPKSPCTTLGLAPLLTFMFLAMAVDGVNSTLNNIGLGFGYVTSNGLRFTTGLSSGIADGLWLLLPLPAAPP